MDVVRFVVRKEAENGEGRQGTDANASTVQQLVRKLPERLDRVLQLDVLIVARCLPQ